MSANPSTTAPMNTPFNLPDHLARELDRPYELSDAQITRFREDGFIKLKEMFSPELLEALDGPVTEATLRLNPRKPEDIPKDDTYGRAFIQVDRMWERVEAAKRIVMSKRAAGVATRLLGTDGVRLWHDQSLYKIAGGGFTPWHVDQQYWPMATGKSVTMWMPFTAVPIDMGPLCFGKGSHLKNIGRDLAISDESEQLIRDAIKKEGVLESFEPYALGEVSFHYGWTLHRAGPNTTAEARRVFTVIYMDKDMALAKPKNQNQKNDWHSWSPSTKIGEVMADDLNPVIYP